MKPKFKPPGAQRLKLNCNILLSTSAFKLNLRRYSMVIDEYNAGGGAFAGAFDGTGGGALGAVDARLEMTVGSGTRCQPTSSNVF
jgi:hypothetical protein